MLAIIFICISCILAVLLGVVVVIMTKLLKRRGMERDMEAQDFQAEIVRLKREITGLQEENRSAVEKVEGAGVKREITENIVRYLAMFIRALPLAESMANIVVKKTEESVMAVSDSIFAIGDESRHVGESINKLLQKVSVGDFSLNNTAAKVTRNITDLEGLLEELKKLYKQFRTDMDVIKKSVQGIGQFNETITDLAEQTSILAINASIEAARVGTHGKGFSVIAGEVQGLSKKSKNLAEQIHETITLTTATVGDSTERQLNQHLRIEGAIEKIETEMKSVGLALLEGIDAVGVSIEESGKLSGKVTGGLSEIIKSLQYQDIIRQVLEHILFIFNDIKHLSKEKILDEGFSSALSDETIFEEIRKKASRHFTVREEWIATGLPIEEKLRDVDGKTNQNNLTGDITLF